MVVGMANGYAQAPGKDALVSQSIGPDPTLLVKISDDLNNAKRPAKVMYFYWDRMIAKKIVCDVELITTQSALTRQLVKR